MPRLNVTEPAKSEWESLIVLVPSKEGLLRFCVDYRKLNDVTIRDAYPIQRMDDGLGSLGKVHVFFILDSNSGYWQIEIDDRDKGKTKFTSHHRGYRF